MEFQVAKQAVFVGETVYSENLEQAVDVDISLPDYCPDISRILKCRITPKINSRTVSSGTLSIDGTAFILLLYVDGEKNEIRSYEHPVPFQKEVNVGPKTENGVISILTNVDYVNSRAVTQRKVDVHGALGLQVAITSRRPVDIVSDVDGGGLETLGASLPATTLISTGEKYLVLSDELEIASGKQPIRSILRSDARAILSDCKMISNKVIVKGEVLISSLYSGEEDGKLETYENTLPYSQVIDIDGIQEDCSCSVHLEVVSLELRPRTNMNGESRTLGVSVKLLIIVKAYCSTEIPVLYDAYSTEYEMTLEKADIPLEKIVCDMSETYLCKKTLDMPESVLTSVIDLWCETLVKTVRNEENQLVIAGVVLLCILGKDAEGAPVYHERAVDYEYQYGMSTTPRQMRCEPEVAAVAASYTFTGADQLEVRVELSVSARVFEQTHALVLTELALDESKPKAVSSAALYIYYAGPGENVWDIARRYNTSVDEVVDVNHLSSHILPEKTMLLIPAV